MIKTLSAAEEFVEYGGRVQFKEISEVLVPLIDEKNSCSERMIQNDIPTMRREFCKCQCAVKAAVDKVYREDWILKVANEAEAAMRRGKCLVGCMKKLQIAHCECKPVHSQISAIVDENGGTLNSHSNVCARWRYHFLNVLSVPSSIQEEVVNSVM